MMRSPLSVLFSAALATAVLPSVPAQQNSSKPPVKSAQSNPSTGTKDSTKSVPPQTPPKPAPTPGSKVDNDVVGVVNSKNITWGQLLTRLQQDQPQVYNASVGQIIGGQAVVALFGPNPKASFTITREEALTALRQHPNRQIVDQLDLMLDEEAITQQSVKEGAVPTVQQLDAQIAKALKQIRGKDPSFPVSMTDDQFLQSKKITREKMRENFGVRARIINLIEKEMRTRLGHPVRPDDFVQASHLLIAVKDPQPDAKPEERKKAEADALARIKVIEEAIKTGKKTFDQAVKESSDDTDTRPAGGDLGMFVRGTMAKDFEDAAFSAKTGVMSAPVRTQFGYHLIIVTKHGNELSADDWQAFLDDYEAHQIPGYLYKLTGQLNKVENRLAALLPPQPGVGMTPGSR